MTFNNAVDATQTGFQSITAGGVWNGRTLTAGTGINITNGDGTAGSPTITNTGVTTFTNTTAWTPNLQFGGAQVGITYANQTGWYAQVGDIVYYQYNIVLTSKGTSVGTATISNMPVAVGASNVGTVGSAVGSAITFPVGQTFIVSQPVQSTSTLIFNSGGSTTSTASLANTNFANTTQIVGSGFYTVN